MPLQVFFRDGAAIPPLGGVAAARLAHVQALAYVWSEHRRIDMTVAAMPVMEVRTTRLTALVSEAEAAQVAMQAAAAGLSVSAYLRDRALGVSSNAGESAALQQLDALIDRIEADLDSAIAEVSATIARMGTVA